MALERGSIMNNNSENTSKQAFIAATGQAQGYTLRQMIALEFLSLMERDYGIENGIARIEGDDESGYRLEIGTRTPLNRDIQLALMDMDQTLFKGVVDLQRSNYPIRFDAQDRVIETPSLEMLIGLLGVMPNYADEAPAFTPRELLEAHGHGQTGPALQLH
jgi:hypothetical protein